MSKGEEKLNFSISRDVKEYIVKYSNGLAAVCHLLCLNLCHVAEIVETLEHPISIDSEELLLALVQYFEESSDTLKAAFDKAFKAKKKTKFDNYRLILRALTEFDQEGTSYSDILANICRRIPNYPAGNCKHCLRQLQNPDRGEILRYDAVSGRFSFSDPLYRAFAIALFEKEKKQQIEIFSSFIKSSDINEMLKEISLNVVKFLIKQVN